jgi:nuclear transport factor 2 (NTF2) superfamily protein
VSEHEEGIVREVFARVRNRDPKVADLYHEDATLTADDTAHQGRDAIRAFYLGVFSGNRPYPQVRGLWVNGSIYAALLEVTRDSGGVIHAVDVFDVDAGGIRSMRVCRGGVEQGWVPLAASE